MLRNSVAPRAKITKLAKGVYTSFFVYLNFQNILLIDFRDKI